MFAINQKTLVCFLIVLILTVSAGFGGLILGFNVRNFVPSLWLSYFPKIGAENLLPLEFSEKPIRNVYLNIEGNVKNITAAEITIEDNGKSKTLKLEANLKPLKMQIQEVTNAPSVPPEAMGIKDIKVGNHVSATVVVTKSEWTVISLIVIVN